MPLPYGAVNSSVVFPEPSVQRDQWMGWAEPQVNFYLASTRPEAVAARAWINTAYQEFPDPSGEFAGRLRSADDVQHVSALAELFVHNLLIGHGTVVHEEGGRGPDFRIYHDEQYVAAVEVCTLFESNEWAAEQKRNARIIDELNKHIPLDAWFINFEVIQLDREPSIKRLVEWVNATIGQLPTGPADSADPVTQWFTHAVDGVVLRFRFLRRTSSSPPKPTDRVVGFGPVQGGFVDSHLRLRSALEKKVQKRYDTRSKPFAIFVGAWDWGCTTDQLEDALLGNEQVLINSGELRRANNGFFGRDQRRPEGRHAGVSSVFALHGWRPWQPENQRILRFDNPFTTVPFPDELLPADYRLGVVQEKDEQGLLLKWTPGHPGMA
jgi:hypothetical protein